MNTWRMYKALFRHQLKVVLLLVVCLPVFWLLGKVLPFWAVLLAFFAWAFLIFFPAVFAIGPVGRWIGRDVNETAVEEYEKANRRGP